MSEVLRSLAEDVPWPDDAIEVARVGEAWGVKGWFRVIAFATDPQAIFSSRRWFIKPPTDGRSGPLVAGREFPELLRITDSKAHGDGVVAHAQGLQSRADAEALRGARVFVARSSFPTEATGEYYWVDLIGLEVVNRKGEILGAVQGLIDTGPQSVLRVSNSSNPAASEDQVTLERLIPFVAAYVDDVDLPGKRIRVDWELDY